MKTIRFEEVPVNTIFHYESKLGTKLEFVKILQYSVNDCKVNAICISDGDKKGRVDFFLYSELVKIEENVTTFGEIKEGQYFIYNTYLYRKQISTNPTHNYRGYNIQDNVYKIFENFEIVTPVKNVQFTYEI